MGCVYFPLALCFKESLDILAERARLEHVTARSPSTKSRTLSRYPPAGLDVNHVTSRLSHTYAHVISIVPSSTTPNCTELVRLLDFLIRAFFASSSTTKDLTPSQFETDNLKSRTANDYCTLGHEHFSFSDSEISDTRETRQKV